MACASCSAATGRIKSSSCLRVSRAEFVRFWEQKFAGLDGYLKEMQEKEKGHARNT